MDNQQSIYSENINNATEKRFNDKQKKIVFIDNDLSFEERQVQLGIQRCVKDAKKEGVERKFKVKNP